MMIKKFEIRITVTRKGGERKVDGERERVGDVRKGRGNSLQNFSRTDTTDILLHVLLIYNNFLECLITGSLPSWKVRV
jgi:hypothetical protein